MEPTRETFGNIPPSSQHLFYALAVVAGLVFLYGLWRRFRLWRQGLGGVGGVRVLLASRMARLKPGLRRLLIDGLGQKRVRGRGAAGRMHIVLFAGFMMLLLGTTLLEIDHLAAMISPNFSFHHGTYYVVYEFTLDVFGLLFLAGCGYFLWRRTRRPASVGHRATDWWVLGMFIAIGVTGYLVEGLRIVWQRPAGAGAHCSPVGLWLAQGLFSGLDEPGARAAHFAGWWLHAGLVFGFFAAIPFTRLLHIVAGPLHLFFARPGLGQLLPVTMESVEATGRIGVSEIRHLTPRQLLSLDACMECGRCEDACPAFTTGKPLSPKKVVQDLKRLMEDVLTLPPGAPAPRALHDDTIGAETLWACTACSACVDVCPVRIDQLTLILDLRRHLVAEGGLSGTAATALRRMQSAANPWGLPADERARWTEALNA
ncbi:MAG: 4Fe-4S dicluster domain-containing protein [Opitutaceae bacterium]|nr:4Fe-4S dicluster domain-containing protein [Opitutaceae bacterium]